MRTAQIVRTTKETDIKLSLNIDGSGKAEIDTGVGFLDHMLTLFAVHGRFDLAVSCKGDTNVDDHHSVEDIGIALGEAFAQAMGDKKGISRYAGQWLPMDETLVLSCVDISGRGFLNYDLDIPSPKVGNFDTELVEEFFIAFCRNSGICLHLKQFDGRNSHHIIEATFKGTGRALREAFSADKAFANEIPSSKGVL